MGPEPQQGLQRFDEASGRSLRRGASSGGSSLWHLSRALCGYSSWQVRRVMNAVPAKAKFRQSSLSPHESRRQTQCSREVRITAAPRTKSPLRVLRDRLESTQPRCSHLQGLTSQSPASSPTRQKPNLLACREDKNLEGRGLCPSTYPDSCYRSWLQRTCLLPASSELPLHGVLIAPLSSRSPADPSSAARKT